MNDYQMLGMRSGGCDGEYHQPRPYIGDPPFPRAFSCYCGARAWLVQACPTCGQDRTVRAEGTASPASA